MRVGASGPHLKLLDGRRAERVGGADHRSFSRQGQEPSQAANRVMQTQESGGSIVNIASVSTIRPSPGTAAYGAAKAGLVNLGSSLAVEWAPKVRVNAVIVGLTQTEQAHLHYGDEEGIAAVGATIPLGRMAVPADIGNACLFLASPAASYVSGTSFAVHGGGEKPAFLNVANVAK